ncbi:chalcone isomerase family protein [Bdellovibrionota bacterium FG-2]
MKKLKFRNLNLSLVVFAATLTLSSPLSAKELNGVTMPDQMTVAGKNLTLNGLGMRLALFIKVKVYVGGLYLETPSKNPEEILASPQIKHVEMKFLRDVGAGKMVSAWNESLEKNCKTDCATLKPMIDKLNSAMVDMKEGDTMSFTFLADGVDVTVKQKKDKLEGAALSKLLLTTWLGPNPPNNELKDGMLGKK